MAGNPKWCQPVDQWKKYFSDWIKTPGPDELLEVSIFFDFRHCYGEMRLTDELNDFVRKDLKANDIYFHHMAAAWKLFTPSVSLLSEQGTDIKRVLMPLTGIIRLYALKYGVTGLSSVERIMELHSSNNLDVQMLRETIRAWKDLTTLRLSHHASCINRDTEPDNIIDFQMADKEMRCFAEQAISIINNLMMKAGSDFYTVTI